MRIAFYAPLKAPDHPIPSGDRRVAQLLLEALRQAGHAPMLASRFRSFEGRGDVVRQARLAAAGKRLACRLISRYRAAAPDQAPQLWFTYHLYHKAPDWLGPIVAEALGIPYVIAEASHAPKQAGGPWAAGHRAAERAIRRADAVIGLNPADRDCVLPLLADSRRWIAIKPFLDAAAHPVRAAFETRSALPRLVAVAMMRPGDKLASYRILAAALARLGDVPWSLELIGDGTARHQVEALFEPIAARVTWAGRLDPSQVKARLAAADLCVWPAVNEAFGMALLEAQAAGLPIVAGEAGGVSEIVVSGVTGLLVPSGDVPAFSSAVRRLLSDPNLREAMAHAARRQVLAEHDISRAAPRLGALIDGLTPARAAS